MFRFTIRELALVMVIVAMGAAWWIDRAALKGSQVAELEIMRRTEYKHYQYEVLGAMRRNRLREAIRREGFEITENLDVTVTLTPATVSVGQPQPPSEPADPFASPESPPAVDDPFAPPKSAP